MPDPLVVVTMSKILVKADACDPDHRRHRARMAFDPKVSGGRADSEPSMRAIGEVAKKIIADLKARRNSTAKSKSKPRPRIAV